MRIFIKAVWVFIHSFIGTVILLLVLSTASHAQLPPLPGTELFVTQQEGLWSPAQWQMILNAARHSAGANAFEYKAVFYTDIKAARSASLIGPKSTNTFTVNNLIEVAPALRKPLAELYSPKSRCEPFEFTNTRGQKGWVVIELIRRSPTTPLVPGLVFEAQARRWIKAGLLPDPDKLQLAAEQSRSAYWQARTPQQVLDIPAELSPNVMFGNFSTPLLHAILGNKLETIQALVKKGADVNMCGIWGCPLALASSMKPEDDALAAVDWLLKQGAKVDGLDMAFKAGRQTALTSASEQGYVRVSKALVAAGASLDGLPKVRRTPVEAAGMFGHEELVRWLVAQGANVLPMFDRSRDSSQIGANAQGTLFGAVAASGNANLTRWAEKMMLDAAKATPAYQYGAHIEQNGQRYPLTVETTLELKAAPFKLVFTLAPKEAEALKLSASLDKAWLEEIRKHDPRNAFFRPFSGGAMTDASKPDSYELWINTPCSASAKQDDGCEGSHMTLSNDSESDDFHEKRPKDNAYVREVRSVYDVSAPAKANIQAVPLEALAGKSLYIAMGTVLNIGEGNYFRLISSRLVQINFK